VKLRALVVDDNPNNLLLDCDARRKVLCGDDCPLQETMHDGKPREADVLLRHRNGERVPVRVRSRAGWHRCGSTWRRFARVPGRPNRMRQAKARRLQETVELRESESTKAGSPSR